MKKPSDVAETAYFFFVVPTIVCIGWIVWKLTRDDSIVMTTTVGLLTGSMALIWLVQFAISRIQGR